MPQVSAFVSSWHGFSVFRGCCKMPAPLPTAGQGWGGAHTVRTRCVSEVLCLVCVSLDEGVTMVTILLANMQE